MQLVAHSKKVQLFIRRLKTPAQVQRWIHSLDYNPGETMRTLNGVVETKSAHCLEAALAAAVILEHRGYPPLILDLESRDLIDHTLFLFQHEGNWGTVAMSRDIGLHGRKPVYRTLRALVRSYAVPYIDERASIKAYGVLDLRLLADNRWRYSSRNVWYVEEALRNIPHQKFSLSSRSIALWRHRYAAFKINHPGQQPDYYPNQKSWI